MGIRSTGQARWVSQTSGFVNNLGAETGPDIREPAIGASGGTKTSPGDGYTYHYFTASGSLVINGGSGDMDVLLVGGGGGQRHFRGPDHHRRRPNRRHYNPVLL